MNPLDRNKDGQVDGQDAKRAGIELVNAAKDTASEIQGMTPGQQKVLGIVLGVGIVLTLLVVWLA